MAGKKLIRKEVQPIIAAEREAGKTDQEIYYQLREEYFDRMALAQLITGTPTAADKLKYKVHNNLLVFILSLSLLFTLLYVFSLWTDGTLPLWGVFIALGFGAFIKGYFIYGIARYEAPVYRLCGLLSIVGFTQTMRIEKSTTDIVFDIAATALVCGLSFYLYNYLFPRYSASGPKKDTAGEYVMPR